MHYPHSTKHKPTLEHKSSTPKFFKKLSSGDQNERNWLNYVGRAPLSTKNLISMANKSDVKSKCFLKQKKSQVMSNILSKQPSKTNLISHIEGSKTAIVLHCESVHTSTHKDKKKSLRKQSSVKQLKLTTCSSIQFPPQLLGKSASHSTIHRKNQDQKLRLLEKIGMKKKSSQGVVGSRGGTSANREGNMGRGGVNLGWFRLGRKLGCGRFGNVYLAEQKSTGGLFAIKVMNKAKIRQADMQDQVFWQIKLQMFMSHPNILKLYTFFHDSKNIYLVLQYCSQCLFKEFRAKGHFSQEQTAYYAKQLISALKYIHNESIIHRDIKPENIMLEHGVIKLSDFGWSTFAPVHKRRTFCGTADYVPPEIVEGQEYDERVDIWALGVLLFQLASGRAPFQTKDQNITYEKIVHCQCRCPSTFSKQLKQTIGRILDKNPERRPDLDQIQSEDWFQRHKAVGRFISKQIWALWERQQ